jgi:hypothetical protein
VFNLGVLDFWLNIPFFGVLNQGMEIICPCKLDVEPQPLPNLCKVIGNSSSWATDSSRDLQAVDCASTLIVYLTKL